ncbi:MAG: beta keto-acyl synthase, partial [Myxococcota bacterium]|nr:beta keto-acyl synthase [Myxococcota bacterium]
GSSFVCQAHTAFTRDILGIQPEVSMGLSSGETNSLMAFGVWNDLDEMLAEIETSEMYANQLTGEFRAAAKHWGLPDGEIPSWKCWRIAAPLEEVEQAIAEEPLVYLTVIHHYGDVVIGGETEACERVLDVLGRQRAMDLGLDMVVHCAPLAPFADLWRQIHARETHQVPDVRFYTNAGHRAYVPTRETAADAITQQALEPIDLPKTIEQAYADGVRVFIEHGPRATVTGAIRHVLEGRPHLVVALDPHEGAGLGQVARAVARLWAAGVTMDLSLFAARMEELCRGTVAQGMPDGAVLRLPVHSPDVLWPKAAPKEPAMKPTPPSPIAAAPDQQGHMAPPPASGWGYQMAPRFAGGGS